MTREFRNLVDHLSKGGRLENQRKKNAMKRSRADHESLIQEKFPPSYMPNVPRQVRNKGGRAEAEKNFRKWAEGSRYNQGYFNGYGAPKVWWHLTEEDPKDFQIGISKGWGNFGELWLTEDPGFTGVGGGGKGGPRNPIPLHVNVKNPFTHRHVDELAKRVKLTPDEYARINDPWLDEETGNFDGNHDVLERGDVLKAIKEMGHDAVEMRENFTNNLMIFEPQGKVKLPFDKYPGEFGAHFDFEKNEGSYDPNDPDIRKSEGGKIEGGIVGMRYYEVPDDQLEFIKYLHKHYPKGLPLQHETPGHAGKSIRGNKLSGGYGVFAAVDAPSNFVTSKNKTITTFKVPLKHYDQVFPDMGYGEAAGDEATHESPFIDFMNKHPHPKAAYVGTSFEEIPDDWVQEIKEVHDDGPKYFSEGGAVDHRANLMHLINGFNSGGEVKDPSKRAMFGMFMPQEQNLPATVDRPSAPAEEGPLFPQINDRPSASPITQNVAEKIAQMPMTRRGFMETARGAVAAARFAPQLSKLSEVAPKVKPSAPFDLGKAKSVMDKILAEPIGYDHPILKGIMSPEEASEAMFAAGRNPQTDEDIYAEESQPINPFRVHDLATSPGSHIAYMDEDLEGKIWDRSRAVIRSRLEKEIGQKLSDDDFEKLLKQSAEEFEKADKNAEYFANHYMDVTDNFDPTNFMSALNGAVHEYAKQTGEKVPRNIRDFFDRNVDTRFIAKYGYDIPEDKIDYFLNKNLPVQTDPRVNKFDSSTADSKMDELMQFGLGEMDPDMEKEFYQDLKQSWREGLQKHKESNKRVKKAFGGSMGDDQPPSIGHNNPPEDFEHPESYRELNAFGLYSKAAEVAQDATGQNVMQTPDQWEKYLLARGVKPDEIKWSSFRDSFDDRNRKYHKDEIASQFNYDNQVPYEETLYSDEGNKYSKGLDGISDFIEDVSRNPSVAAKILPESEILKLEKMDEKQRSDYLFENHTDIINDYIESGQKGKPTRHSEYQMEGPHSNYRELVLQHDPDKEKFKEVNHFNDSNPLLHIRMSDRIGPNGEKLLHIEELQSDWGQEGRRAGFNEEDKKVLNKKWNDANKALNDFDFSIRNKYRQEYEKAGIDPYSIERMIDGSSLSYLLRKDGTSEERDQYSKLSSDERKHYNNFRSPIVEEGPHINDTNKWVDLGLKRILKEAADGGYEGITFAPGDNQVARWNDKGLKKPYDETIPSRMQKLLNKIDPQLKFGSYALDLPIWKDEQSGAVATNRVHHVPLNAEHHAEIKKGFERMKRGGAVVQNELDPAKQYEKETGKVHPDLKFSQKIPGTKERMSKMRADVPVRWSSSPDHATAHLAYITDAEAELLKKADLHNSNIANEHHVGPGGVPSYQGGGIGNGGGSYSGGSSQESGGDTGGDFGGDSNYGGGNSNNGGSDKSSSNGQSTINVGGQNSQSSAPETTQEEDLGNSGPSLTGPYGFGTTDVGKALVENVLGGGNATATAPGGISNYASAPSDPGYTSTNITAMRTAGDTAENLNKLQSLDPSFQTKAATLINRAIDLGMSPTITSAGRTLADQQRINEDPNQTYPSALPGQSLHNYGLAIDLGSLTPSQQSNLGQIATQEGMEWGGVSDPVHYGIATPGMTNQQAAASLGANLYTGAKNVAQELLGINQASASELTYPEKIRGISTAAPQSSNGFNVPNAGDLYGATNAPLAVQSQPQTVSQFDPTKSEEGAAARQGDVPGMSSEALEWNKAYTDALNKIYGSSQSAGLDKLSNKINEAVANAPQTAEQLSELGAAINLPFGIGSYIGSQYGVQPATEKQQAEIANVINQANMPQSIPADFATEAGIESRYGMPPEENTQRAGSIGSMPSSYTVYDSNLNPVNSSGPQSGSMGSVSANSFKNESGNIPLPPERPSEFEAMTPSTGRKDYESKSPKQSVRASFDAAFAAARKAGRSTFVWRNPFTGVVGVYTTEMRSTGGATNSSVSKNEKLLHTSPAVEIALSKVSSLPLDAVKLIKNGTRGRS